MQEIGRVNIRQNLQMVIQIATKYSDALGPVKLIETIKSFKMSIISLILGFSEIVQFSIFFIRYHEDHH